jgi:hypothetical protein
MAKVLRLEPGGGFVVEAAKLSMQEAKEMAARLAKEAGDSPRCSWCVGLEDDEEERPGDLGS